jgi:hydrogenase nickel incorporation protein HypA/HybF
MHELSLLQEMLEIAVRSAQGQGAKAIHRIRLQVGEMSGVVPEALSFAFPLAAQGTMAAGALLELESIPVVAFCLQCDREFQPSDVIYLCPNCGRPSGDIRSGGELTLHSMEVSTNA